MKIQRHRRLLTSMQRTYLHHIAWGVVSLLLLTGLLSVWTSSQKLEQKTRNLEARIANLSKARVACESRDVWQAGTTRNFSVATTGGMREYIVHLPKDFSPNQYYPAVIFFAGKGSSASAAVAHAGITELPAVTIFPQPTIGKDGMYAWQGAPYSSGADDVTFVSDVLDKVQGQLCIDRSRVYAAGWSNGGGMASLLSCRMSERFAAFGIIAGAFYYPTSECTPTGPTPIISIHGDSDGTVPYGGSLVRKLPNIDSWSASRAKLNGCSPRPFVSHPDAFTSTTTWQFCKDGATVEHIKLHGAGHAWTPSMAPALWRFMSRQSL